MKHLTAAAVVVLVALSVTALVASCSKTRTTEQPTPTMGPVPAEVSKAEKPEAVGEEAKEEPQTTEAQAGEAPEAEEKAEAGAEGKEVTLTDANFDDIIGKQGTVALVDFWAPWCGPCREQAPIIEELAEEYAGKVLVGKVNTDENEKLSERFGINAIPTLIVFKDGKEVDRKVGLTEKQELEAMIDKALGG